MKPVSPINEVDIKIHIYKYSKDQYYYVMKIVNMASSIAYMVYAVKTVICPICPGMTMVRNMIAI